MPVVKCRGDLAGQGRREYSWCDGVDRSDRIYIQIQIMTLEGLLPNTIDEISTMTSPGSTKFTHPPMGELKGASPTPDLSNLSQIRPGSTNRCPPHLVKHKDCRAGRHRRRVIKKEDTAKATVYELVAEEEAAVFRPALVVHPHSLHVGLREEQHEFVARRGGMQVCHPPYLSVRTPS